MSVLVIESDHNTRVEVRRMLEDAGHFVVSSANGAGALAQLENMSTPSVIFLASSLALMNADQVLAVLKSNPDFAAIPVVQIKGPEEPHLEGVSCTLNKPINQVELLECLKAR